MPDTATTTNTDRFDPDDVATTESYLDLANTLTLPPDRNAGPRMLTHAGLPPVVDVFGGRFFVSGMAAGGMGRVFFLADQYGATKFALKTVASYEEWKESREQRGAPAPARAEYDWLRQRFVDEAGKWVALGRHRHVTHALMVLEIGKRPYLLMELAEGGDLCRLLRAEPRGLAIPRALDLATQVVRGLRYAYDKSGLIHQDVKPANILLDRTGTAKLADFGLARMVVRRPDNPLGGLGDENEIRGGTPTYMAPEQAYGEPCVASDLFAVGIMLYRMLTGEHPFPLHRSGGGAPGQLRGQAAPRLSSVLPNAPEPLCDLVDGCLELDLRRRIATHEDFLGRCQLVAKRFPQPQSPEEPASLSDPWNLEPVFLQGLAYSLLSLERYEQAAEVARRSVAIEPHEPFGYLNLGTALARSGRFLEAEQAYQQALRYPFPNREALAVAWANLSFSQSEQNKWTEAIRNAEAATQTCDTCSLTWMARGNAERGIKRFSEAKRSWQRALQCDPQEWRVHANLGRLHLDLEEWSDAVSSLKSALDLAPEDPSIRADWVTALELARRSAAPAAASAEATIKYAFFKEDVTTGTLAAAADHVVTKRREIAAIDAAEASLKLHGKLRSYSRNHRVSFEPVGAMDDSRWEAFLDHRYGGRPWRRWYGRMGSIRLSIVVIGEV